MKSSGASKRWAPAAGGFASETAWAFPGWDGHAARAKTAAPAAKTCATTRASRATRSTAATRSSHSPTSDSASRCPGNTTMFRARPALRRAHRLPLPAKGWRLALHRALRLRRRRAYHHPDCSIRRARHLRIHRGREDAAAQEFARSLGAAWAGPSEELPPRPLDAAIIFAPIGALVPKALRALRKAASSYAAAFT